MREVVDLARPEVSWRSAKVSGSSACTTVETSIAARSTARVPLLAAVLASGTARPLVRGSMMWNVSPT
jgi:hypothetical protein